MSEDIRTENIVEMFNPDIRREDEIIISRNKDYYATSVEQHVVELTAANTEYDLAIPDGTRRIRIYSRNNKCRYAFETGEVATVAATAKYSTQLAGAPEYIEPVKFDSMTLYLASSGAGDVVEVQFLI